MRLSLYLLAKSKKIKKTNRGYFEFKIVNGADGADDGVQHQKPLETKRSQMVVWTSL